MLRQVLRRYTIYKSAEVRLSFLVSFIIFFCSIVYNFYGSSYATLRASNYVDDIILSNIPVFDVGWIFVWGAIALIIFVLGLCLTNPKRIPFILHSLSLFYFIRGTFVMMTHLGPFPTKAELNVDLGTLFAKQFGGNDLFFSAHTGAPFLLALIFWEHRLLRYIFLTWSLVFGVVVLLGHFHYTIDVLSAFFITFTIFQIAKWLFPKDFRLFHSDL